MCYAWFRSHHFIRLVDRVGRQGGGWCSKAVVRAISRPDKCIVKLKLSGIKSREEGGKGGIVIVILRRNFNKIHASRFESVNGEI